MKLARLLLSKTVITTLVAIAALIAFNSLNSSLESELLADFNEWYPKTAAVLDGEGQDLAPSSKVKVTIKRSGVWARESSSVRTFPAHSLADATDRAQTARVLQLISESKLFGLPAVSRQREDKSYLTVSITDDAVSFQTTVSTETVEQSIQLQNLVKLLEIYAATPPSPINPAQL